MARAPDQRAEEARKLFDSGMKLIEISEKLGVPEGTVRSWKNRYKWNNATLQKEKCNVARKKGGQPGNKNAKGHGGTGPPGNKNAVKTGEFEALFFDTLDAKEILLFVGSKNEQQVYGGKSYILCPTPMNIVYEKELFSASGNSIGTGFYAYYNNNVLLMKCKTSSTVLAQVYTK